MRFFVDAQLPPLLARYLSQLGHEAEHVADAVLASARDRDIWKHASAVSAVLITKDQDFITMRALNPDGPCVVWVRLGNTTRRALLTQFSRALPRIVAAVENGEAVIEVSNT